MFRDEGNDFVTVFADGPRHVVQGLLTTQTHVQDLARMHAFDGQFGLYEGHGTDFVRNIYVDIGLGSISICF